MRALEAGCYSREKRGLPQPGALGASPLDKERGNARSPLPDTSRSRCGRTLRAMRPAIAKGGSTRDAAPAGDRWVPKA